MKFTAIAIAFLSQIALVLSGTYPARAEDVDACAALNEPGLRLTGATKMYPMNCVVQCDFDNGSVVTAFVKDGTECDELGDSPTGRCKKGQCPTGNL